MTSRSSLFAFFKKFSLGRRGFLKLMQSKLHDQKEGSFLAFNIGRIKVKIRNEKVDCHSIGFGEKEGSPSPSGSAWAPPQARNQPVRPTNFVERRRPTGLSRWWQSNPVVQGRE